MGCLEIHRHQARLLSSVLVINRLLIILHIYKDIIRTNKTALAV